MSVRFKRIAAHASLAVFGSALFCGDALVPGLTILPYVALVPWTILYTDPERPKVSSLPFLAAACLCWIGCYPMTFRLGWFVPFATAPFFIPAWALFPLLIRPIQRLGLPRSFTLPVVWVAVEWARALLASGHLDMFALGYSQAHWTSLVQIADWSGVYGVTFLVAAVNGLLADTWFALRGAAWRPRVALRQRRLIVATATIVSALGLALGYGRITLLSAHDAMGPRLAVVQPDASPDGRADLFVWPGAGGRDDDTRLAAVAGAPVLVGASGLTHDPSGRATRSAFLFGGPDRLLGRYDKRILSPFSEYLPFDTAAGALSPAVQRAYHGFIRSVWGTLPTAMAGTRAPVLELPGAGGTVPFGILLGFENVYPPLAAEACRHGARFLVNLTDEREVPGPIQEQHLRASMLRAVENRVAYVRAGSPGLTAFIDPQGRLRAVSRDARGLAIDAVPLSGGGRTVYAASRDAFALSCVAVSLWLLARALLRGRPAMTPHPIPAVAPG